MWWTEIILIILAFLILSINSIMAYRLGRHTHPIPPTEFQRSSEYNRSQKHDIYHIAFLLRQRLVPDVIPQILHDAGIFERHTHSTGVEGRPMVITQNSAPCTTLATPPIQSSVRLQNPVRKVVFSIKSSDQGWASNRDSGSWTWFTVGVYPRNEDGAVDLQSEDVMRVKRDDRFLAREREIFRNDVASREMKTHIIEWSVDSDDEEDVKWVQALENGDRIAVRAWAQFSGWQNNVKSVSVAIYTAALI